MSINENLSSNLILTIRLKVEVAMNKKGLGQGKLFFFTFQRGDSQEDAIENDLLPLYFRTKVNYENPIFS